MKRSSEVSLKEALAQLVDAYRIGGKLNETRVIAAWPKLMGPVVANRTSGMYIRNRKLFVKLTSAPLREELIMAREKIIAALNDEAGAAVIDDVVFS